MSPRQPDPEQIISEYDAVIDAVADGIYITDAGGVTLRVNRAFEQLTGLRADQVVGRHVRDCLKAGFYNQSVSLLVLERRAEVSMIERLRNGREAMLTGRPVFDDDGNITRVVTTLRDMRELNRLKADLARIRREEQLKDKEISFLRNHFHHDDGIVVADPAFQRIIDQAVQLAGIDSTVLISGESGVGKEIVTRVIHHSGKGNRSPFIAVNCAALPENLLESELFGYEKGAFTGAEREGKPGFFEVAGNGTLFLDEISELTPALQVKLLRALQEREIVRVGGRKPISIEARIIAATNSNLQEEIDRGRFRRDLYYRLNVVPLHIPPLRERVESILPLATRFLEEFNSRFRVSRRLSREVILYLESYSWPGNVRELRNVVERMVALGTEDEIVPDDLPAALRSQAPVEVRDDTVPSLEDVRSRAERTLVDKVYRRTRSTRETARLLKTSQSTISRKIQEYGISL